MATLPKRPAKLTTAIVICYVQTVFTFLAAVLVLSEVSDRVDHGQEVPGMAYSIAVLFLILGSVMLASAVLLTRGVVWARYSAATVEWVNILSWVVGLLAGVGAVPSGVLAIALSTVVLVGLFGPDVTAWFEQAGSRRVGQHAPNAGPVDFSGPTQGQ